MPHASTVRLSHTLPLAFGLAFAWPEAADAGLYVPEPLPQFETSAAAQPAPAKPRLLPVAGVAPALGIDAEGRSLSVSVPTKVLLYGLARAEQVAARPVLQATADGAPQLGLALERPVADHGSAGAYVGVLRMTLDYN